MSLALPGASAGRSHPTVPVPALLCPHMLTCVPRATSSLTSAAPVGVLRDHPSRPAGRCAGSPPSLPDLSSSPCRHPAPLSGTEALPSQRDPAREHAGTRSPGAGLGRGDPGPLSPRSGGSRASPRRGRIPGRRRTTAAASGRTGFCGGLGAPSTAKRHGLPAQRAQGPATPRGSDGRLRGLGRPQESSVPGRGERSQQGADEPGFKPQRPQSTYQTRTFPSGNPLPG